MLALICFFLILSSGSAFCSAVFQRKYEEVLPITCSAMVLLLFLSGIAGNLKIGAVILCILCGGLYVAAVIWAIKQKNVIKWLQNIFTPGFFVYLVWSIVLVLILNGKVLHSWDEFSHWGDIVKVMVAYDDFGTNLSAESMFPSYPPGMGLFQYMLQVLYLWTGGSGFCEWLLYIAYHMLAFSFLAAFVKGEGKKGIFYAILYGGILLLVPTVFYEDYYTTLYIDPFLGVLSGAGLAKILLSKKKDIFYSLYILMACSMLVLAKDAGILFAIIIGCAYLADRLLDEKKYNRTMLFHTILVVGAITLPKLLWNLEVQTSQVQRVFDAPIDIGQLILILLNKDKTYRSLVWHTYWEKFGILQVLIPILFFCILLKWGMKKGILEKKKGRLLLIVVVLQAIVYAVGLAVAYIFKFTEYEASKLASYDRYIHILHLSIWIIIVLSCIHLVYNIVKMDKKLYVYMGCIYLIAVVPMVGIVMQYAYEMVRISLEVRKEYEETAEVIRQYAEETERIYVIAEESNGYERLVLKYLLRPYRINDTGYSIGEKFYEGDIWTVQKAQGEWMDELCTDYDYVILYEINDYFIQNYGELFDEPVIREKGLYRINKTARKLECVQ